MVKRYKEILLMIIIIGIMYYLPIDILTPYILPITLIGVLSIIGFACWHFKQRGLFLLMIGVCLWGNVAAAYDLIDCGGTHSGKNYAERILSGEIVAGSLQAIRDSMGGNIVGSDFHDKKVLACVLINIANVKSELCNAAMENDTYDPDLRTKAFYVNDNYLRMSMSEARGNIAEQDWIREEISDHADLMSAYSTIPEGLDAQDVRKCAMLYIEYCAMVDKKLEDSCPTMAEVVQKSSKDCWVCNIVEVLLLAMQRVASGAYFMLRHFSLGLLGVMFLFWIAFKVLNLIGTMGMGEHNAFFTEFLTRCCTVMIAVAILHAPIVDFYRIVISPAISLTAALGMHLTTMGVSDGTTTFYQAAREQMTMNETETDPRENCQLYCSNLTKSEDEVSYDERQLIHMGLLEEQNGRVAYSQTGQMMLAQIEETYGHTMDYSTVQKEQMGYLGFLDYHSFSGLMCLTCQAFNQTVPFIAIGEAMNCYGIKEGIDLYVVKIPKLPYLLVGYVLVISFSVLAVIIGFYIIDVILRLGFVLALTPLLITAWAFPISRDYTKRGWNLIIYSLLEFLGVAVMMGLFMSIFTCILPGANGMDTANALIQYMKNNDVPALFEVFSGMRPISQVGIVAGAAVVAGSGAALSGMGMAFLLMILGIVFMGMKMLMATGQVVQHLSGINVGIPSVGMEVVGKLASEVTSMAKTAPSTAKAVKDKVKAAPGKAKSMYKNAKQKWQNRKNKSKNKP